MSCFNKLFLFLITLLSLAIFGEREIPKLTSPVVDEMGLLTSQEVELISNSLINLKEESKIQFQVLIANGLGGDSIEDFSIRVVDQWKLGGKDTDKGALFIVSPREKKMRIEVGLGLEGQLTDLKSARIIRGVKPFFRQNNYNAGIWFALVEMAKATGRELKGGAVAKKRRSVPTGPFQIFFIIAFSFLFIFRRMFGRRSIYYTSGGFGSGGRFGGGGSNWSGGGGGFSGGGASGDW